MRHIRPACDDRKYYMRNPLKFRMRFAFVACVSHVTYMWWSRISHVKTTGFSHAITVFVHVIHRVAHVIHMRSAGDDRKYCMRNALNFRMRFGFVARNSHLMQTNITCENHRIFACDICYCACESHAVRRWTFIFSHVNLYICYLLSIFTCENTCLSYVDRMRLTCEISQLHVKNLTRSHVQITHSHVFGLFTHVIRMRIACGKSCYDSHATYMWITCDVSSCEPHAKMLSLLMIDRNKYRKIKRFRAEEFEIIS